MFVLAGTAWGKVEARLTSKTLARFCGLGPPGGREFIALSHYQRESSIRFIISFVGRRWLDSSKALSLVIYSSFDRIS